MTDRGDSARQTRSTWAEGGLLGLARLGLHFQRDPLRCMWEARARYGPTVVFSRQKANRRRKRTLVVTTDAGLVQEVLQERALRSSSLALSGPRGSAQRRVRHSVFREWGATHRNNRALIGRALQRRAIEAQTGAMNALIEATLIDWKPGQQRDLSVEMRDLVRQLSASTLFDLPDPEGSAAIGRAIEEWWAHSFSLGARMLPVDWPGTRYRSMLRSAERLEALILDVIRSKREAGLQGHDIVTRLVREADEAGGIAESELIGQINVLFLAAHETTANAITWTLFLLAQHPQIADELTERLQAAYGGRAPDADELGRVPLLDRVLRESMRVLPVVPIVGRVAMQEIALGGRSLPRSTRILMGYGVLHHLPEHFPEPRRFRPERWLQGEPTPGTYLPFGGGAHGCAGQFPAMVSAELVLAALLQRFTFVVPEGRRIDRRVTAVLEPRGGMPLELLPPDAPGRRTVVGGDIGELVD